MRQILGNKSIERHSRFQKRLAEETMRSRMARHEIVRLEAVLALATQLSAVDKLKLVEHLLLELEAIVERQEPKKREPLSGTSGEDSVTEDGDEEIKRKLWGTNVGRRSRRVVQLEGIWKDVPFNVTADEIREARQELSEALKRRVERQ